MRKITRSGKGGEIKPKKFSIDVIDDTEWEKKSVSDI